MPQDSTYTFGGPLHRYQVTRKGVQITTVELNKKPAASTQTISDASVSPKAMDNLR